jgi:hypothetical protein
MFVKRKEHSGRTYFFLCIAERGGNNGNNGKVMEYSVSLGETLNLSSTRWMEILRFSEVFRSVPLEDVLKVLEKYLANNGLPSETAAGLRAAANGSHRQKAGRRVSKEQRTPMDEREKALQLLGLPLGSSENDIDTGSASGCQARFWYFTAPIILKQLLALKPRKPPSSFRIA